MTQTIDRTVTRTSDVESRSGYLTLMGRMPPAESKALEVNELTLRREFVDEKSVTGWRREWDSALRRS